MDEFIKNRFITRLAPKLDYYRKSSSKLDANIYDKLKVASKLSRHQMPYPMHVVHISESSVVTVCEFRNDRSVRNENLIKNTVAWAKKNNLPIPTTSLHIWISDRQPWAVAGVDKLVPIYVFAAPKNSNFILFPDGSFDALETSQKYDGACLDWDGIKKAILEHKAGEKKNIIYFKGVPSTLKHSRIREQLQLMSENKGTPCVGNEPLFNAIESIDSKKQTAKAKVSQDPSMLVKLDAWQSYDPIWSFAKYKYLLNLPGHYPWSNRLKYLFLMKSLVINLDVRTIGSDYIDEPFETIANYIFDEGVDYTSLTMSYYVPKNRHAKRVPIEQVYENNDIYEKLKKVADTPPDVYDRIVNSAFEKANALTNEHVYFYIYQLILFNAEIF
jgi:hypothetical protein